MKWYDFFSNFYDSALEKLYAESRAQAVDWLDLQPGQKVLDVACGTGANFKYLKIKEPAIDLYGTDFSEGMLNKAQLTVEAHQWKPVTLFQADARDLSAEFIATQVGQPVQFDRILCALGLSVIPDWEQVLDQLLELLPSQGRLVIVDVFAEKRGLSTWWVEKVAKADLDRQIWQTLALKTNHFQQTYIPVKEFKVGGKLFVACGVKP